MCCANLSLAALRVSGGPEGIRPREKRPQLSSLCPSVCVFVCVCVHHPRAFVSLLPSVCVFVFRRWSRLLLDVNQTFPSSLRWDDELRHLSSLTASVLLPLYHSDRLPPPAPHSPTHHCPPPATTPPPSTPSRGALSQLKPPCWQTGQASG